MPDPITGITAAASIVGSGMQADATSDAAASQAASSAASIEEQRRQFDEVRKLLAPYVQQGQTALTGLQPFAQAGAPALTQQQALLGLSGNQAQQSAINQISNSPQMQAMMQQGENAILQNASATGGLRGGNTQSALAQFRPALLNSLIDQQYARLGGMTALGQTTQQNLASLGQASAAGVGNAGMQSAANIGGLMTSAGNAQAQNALAQGAIGSNLIGNLTGMGLTAFAQPAAATNIAQQYNTIPGSQQTAMLAAQSF